MPGGVEHNSHIATTLVFRETGTATKREGDGGIEVVHADLEMKHLLLLARFLGPGGWMVVVPLLERESGAAASCWKARKRLALD
jgi:hypothetical protein